MFGLVRSNVGLFVPEIIGKHKNRDLFVPIYFDLAVKSKLNPIFLRVNGKK